jgi:ABC-type multidrug transport system fused ATPase/permease subunit
VVPQTTLLVVLHGGRITETGTQAELMAKRGQFFRLASLQAVRET